MCKFHAINTLTVFISLHLSLELFPLLLDVSLCSSQFPFFLAVLPHVVLREGEGGREGRGIQGGREEGWEGGRGKEGRERKKGGREEGWERAIAKQLRVAGVIFSSPQ